MKSIEDEENELKKNIVWGNGINDDTEIVGKTKDDWVVVTLGVKKIRGHIFFEKIKRSRFNKETRKVEVYQEGPVFFKDLSSDMRSILLEGAKTESLIVKEEKEWTKKKKADKL